jgi:diadenosine tetraphosphate (Ap4A) HIT family hydrolase
MSRLLPNTEWTVSEEVCLLCRVAQGDPPEWYDVPLFRRRGVGFAIAGVGAFEPGYLLVAPEAHAGSSISLGDAAYSEFLSFLWETRRDLERVVGATTLYEHGSCAVGRARSACIYHAHVHLMAGRHDVWASSSASRSRAFGSLEEFRAGWSRSTPYVVAEEAGATSSRTIRAMPDIGVSQYFRRVIAKQLGRPSEWDYAVFPRWENVRATIALFGGSTGSKQEGAGA